jgi:cellulose synthase/poly-beta-1,6-N-acetylglucosamine synthase-like glycosyltransferase
MTVLQLIFWLGAVLMVYSYLVYPVLLYLFSLNKKENAKVFEREEELPVVCVLMSVHNEQEIIEKKLQSLSSQYYPKEKMFILIGSDDSTDSTTGIIENYSLKNKNILLYEFNDRRGKPVVINHLAELAKQYNPLALVLTDANVIFNGDTVFELIKHFKNPDIGLVGADIINNTTQNDGISQQ